MTNRTQFSHSLNPMERLIAKAMGALRSRSLSEKTPLLEADGVAATHQMPPLSVAITTANFGEIRRLLLRGEPTHGKRYNSHDDLQRSPLVVACGRIVGGNEALAMLLDAGAPADFRHKPCAGIERGLLTIALSQGAWASSNLLIERMADPLALDSDGRSPMIAAVQGITRDGAGWTEPSLFEDICRHLLSLGADINGSCLSEVGGPSPALFVGDTPMLATRGHPLAMQALLGMGVDRHKANASGFTPLMAAARGAIRHKSLNTLLGLLSHKDIQDSVPVVDENGLDALAHFCSDSKVLNDPKASESAVRACKQMLKAGANPSTAIDVAASMEHPWMPIILAAREKKILSESSPSSRAPIISGAKRL